MFKQIFALVLLCTATSLFAQQFPTSQLTNLADEPVSLADYVGQGKPTVVAIWATWCQPCHVELDHMKSYLDKWENEYGATFLAISIDQRHTTRRIAPLVARKGWNYEVLVDNDGQLQSQLGFRSIPQMYVLDGAGRIVKSFSGYRQGREQEVDRMIKKLSK